MGKALMITSGKGGVGKSTVAANLAAALADRGLRVALIDADTGLRSLDLLLGMENRAVYDLCDVAEGVCSAKRALLRDERRERLFLLPAAQTRDPSALTPAAMERIVGALKQEFDRVLIDCPAGVGRGFSASAYPADEALIVAQPDAVSLRDAERVCGLLEKRDVLSRCLVMNRVRREDEQGEYAPEKAARRLSLRLIGCVPEDDALRRGWSRGALPLDVQCPAANALRSIAARLEGEDVPIAPFPKETWRQKLARRLLGEATCKSD